MGPGGVHGFEDAVPHFDAGGHLRTHSEIERLRHRARRRRARVRMEEVEAGTSALGSFGMVCAVLAYDCGGAGGDWAVVGVGEEEGGRWVKTETFTAGIRLVLDEQDR